MREKNNNGITLIALIITILVMLILVGVTVAILVNSNMIGIAQDTANKTMEAHQQESKIEDSMKVGNDTLGEYIDAIGKEKITFYIIRIKDNGDSETLEYIVKKGTTWEKFLSENKIYYPDETTEMRFLIIGAYDISVWGMPENALGAYMVDAGGPICEATGTPFNGPWIFPNDPIKDGVTYNFCV